MVGKVQGLFPFVGEALWKFLVDPAIESHLREGEQVKLALHKHWAAYWQVALESVGVLILVGLCLESTVQGGWWILLWLAVFVAVHAFWLFLRLKSDVFVITNRRVFRVRGPVRWGFATMPVRRIVDYSISESPFAKAVSYGHFVFESAAQEQALREIRYVPQPSLCSDRIQDVVQGVGQDSTDLVSPGGADD
jgi:Bacterial PH domain